MGGIQGFTGIDTAHPIHIENGQTTPSATTHATPSVTTSVANAMIVTSHAFASSNSWTPPSGMTESFDKPSGANSATGLSIEGDRVLQPIAGATGVKTATAAGNADVGNTHILALKPADATLTISTPTGTAANDVLVAAIGFNNSTATVTPPSGWTLVRRMNNASTTANSLAVYRRTAVAGEPSSHAFLVAGGAFVVGGIQGFSGVDTSNPIDVENGQTTASGTAHATPSVTTTTANAMLVTAHTYASANSWTPGTGLTEAYDRPSGSNSQTGQAITGTFQLQATAGATGAKTSTAGGFADVGNTHILALRRLLPNTPPTVSITSPANNMVFPAPASFTLTATASDPDGTITKVDFFQGATLVGTATTSPYSVPVSNLAAGSYSYTAVATDNRSGTTTSTPVNVIVDSLPGVALTSPANNATFTAPANITLSATASDTDGTIQKVEFFYGGTNLIATVTTPPYSVIWTSVPQGTYAITAVATDDRGIPTTSTAVNVTVNQAQALYFIQVDHLNTPRVVANAAGQTVWRWDQQEPFGNNPADENPSGLGAFELPLRLPGQTYDAETGLHYNYYRNYDASIGGYKESDLIGLRGGLNTYAYGASNPLRLFDPSGLACIAIGGTVTCTPPGGPTVSFPRPAGWPAVINPNSPNYHSYNIAVQMGCANPTSVMQGIVNLPTPGSPQPATAQGTPNNATPNTIQSMANLIDQISSFGSDSGNYNNAPVISYLLTTPSGASVVVNVTQPGHPLWPGYVARTINGGSVNNFGEGAGLLQGPNSPLAGQINNVWQAQTQGIINNSAQRCGCQP